MDKARDRMYYVIVMPLDRNGNGPVDEKSGDIRKLTWEVWDQALNTFGKFDFLPDAIDFCEERNAQHEALLNG